MPSRIVCTDASGPCIVVDSELTEIYNLSIESSEVDGVSVVGRFASILRVINCQLYGKIGLRAKDVASVDIYQSKITGYKAGIKLEGNDPSRANVVNVYDSEVKSDGATSTDDVDEVFGVWIAGGSFCSIGSLIESCNRRTAATKSTIVVNAVGGITKLIGTRLHGDGPGRLDINQDGGQVNVAASEFSTKLIDGTVVALSPILPRVIDQADPNGSSMPGLTGEVVYNENSNALGFWGKIEGEWKRLLFEE